MTISYFFSIRGDIFDYFVRKKGKKKLPNCLTLTCILKDNHFMKNFVLFFIKYLHYFFFDSKMRVYKESIFVHIHSLPTKFKRKEKIYGKTFIFQRQTC